MFLEINSGEAKQVFQNYGQEEGGGGGGDLNDVGALFQLTCRS